MAYDYESLHLLHRQHSYTYFNIGTNFVVTKAMS